MTYSRSFTSLKKLSNLMPNQLLLLIFLILISCEKGNYKENNELRWYKGNLHTHSFWSDGDEFPEVIMEWYKNHGYHFVGLSDHNILANQEHWVEMHDSLRLEVFDRYLAKYGSDWVHHKEDSSKIFVKLKTLNEYRPLFEEPAEFLILQSEEISDSFEGKPLHLNATGIQEFVAPQSGNSVTEVLQNNINAVLQQREITGEPMIIHINHPNFHYAITVEDMIALQDNRFFEVFNGHHMVYNFGDTLHMSTESMWDQINIAYFKNGKPPLYGLATDDSHNYHVSGNQWSNSGRGWIYVSADTLSGKSLISSMEQGSFYASTGVELARLEVIENIIYVEVADLSHNYQIQFIGCLENENETRILKQESGNHASFELEPKHLFVRAKIISSAVPVNPIENMTNQVAWTQPIPYSD